MLSLGLCMTYLNELHRLIKMLYCSLKFRCILFSFKALNIYTYLYTFSVYIHIFKKYASKFI